MSLKDLEVQFLQTCARIGELEIALVLNTESRDSLNKHLEKSCQEARAIYTQLQTLKGVKNESKSTTADQKNIEHPVS